MSIRFVIRKNSGSSEFPWAFRDATCHDAENHNFGTRFWSRDCGGYCNAFKTQPEAIEEVGLTPK